MSNMRDFCSISICSTIKFFNVFVIKLVCTCTCQSYLINFELVCQGPIMYEIFVIFNIGLATKFKLSFWCNLALGRKIILYKITSFFN